MNNSTLSRSLSRCKVQWIGRGRLQEIQIHDANTYQLNSSRAETDVPFALRLLICPRQLRYELDGTACADGLGEASE
jgi:hypothetical protein